MIRTAQCYNPSWEGGCDVIRTAPCYNPSWEGGGDVIRTATVRHGREGMT